MPIFACEDLSIAFGHLPLLDHASLTIDAGERIAVIGRNGTGKSTLLRLLSGELLPDAGSIWRAPDLRAARLVQDAAISTSRTVFDVVADGLDELRGVVTAYHHAAVRVAEHATPEALAALGRVHHELDERGGWRVEQQVERVLTTLRLPPDAPLDSLSGGWRRRALLARALVAQPSLLLLDEPTNHLDVPAIEWLETFLDDYAGAVVFVTHDRAFLQKLATRVLELDRGHLTSWPGDYASYLEKKAALLEQESVADAKFDKLMAREETWLRRGVKARRTRDEGRVRALMAMREERANRRTHVGQVRLSVDVADRTGKVVFEADRVGKSYGDTVVVRDVSTRILRGDRVGLIGPNGAGKTTLLRMLVGEVAPDTGEIRRGTNLQVAYFDQQREQLDPDRTVVETIADGNDVVTVGGIARHVYGYLDDFLFSPERARSPVKTLSGGERNRLLLARLLTRPANVLILDEPTNDLDLETLEVLEAQLTAFPGTLLIVTHDRRFLDNVVTSTLVFEGAGRVQEYVGGYADWVAQRPAPAGVGPDASPPREPSREAPIPAPRTKLSFNERRELDGLPAQLAALEAEQARLQAQVAGPDFYKEPAGTIKTVLARLEDLTLEIDRSYRRWDELDSRTK